MAPFTITLLVIMVGAGAHSAAAAFAFAYAPPIPNYGPSLSNWKSSNPAFDFPPIVIPKIKTPQEIIAEHSQRGVNFHGFSMSSNNGGTTIITNRNGEVEAYKLGESPPNPEEPMEIPTIPIKPVVMKPMKFPSGSSSSFGGISTSSFVSSTSVNGKETVVSGFNNIVNDNGNVQQETSYFDSRDTEE